MLSPRYPTALKFHRQTPKKLFTGEYGKQLSVIALIIICLLAFFWLESRLPALNNKAMMGVRTPISSIAFNVVLPVNDTQPVYERISYNFVNWSYTNWKGMLFGLLLGASLLTLFRYLPASAESNNRFLNALKGLGGGIPLSVCVNCATPIAHSMYTTGTRLELALALLISSPTLNIIVLTLLFSLFPLHFVIAKLAGTLFLILVLMPLLVRFISTHDNKEQGASDALIKANRQSNSLTEKLNPNPMVQPINSEAFLNWQQAIFDVLTRLSLNLAWILKIALPFMLVAGLLGSAVIEILPLQQLQNLPVGILSLIGIALLGTFLPVPIAFDVIFSAVLLASGIDPAFVMIFLFTLGSFSIYPFSMLWKTFAARLPVILFLLTAGIGILLGLSVSYYEDYLNREIINTYTQSVTDSTQQESRVVKSNPQTAPAVSIAAPVVWQQLSASKQFRISYIDLALTPASGQSGFLRLEGAAFASDPESKLSAAHVLEPFNFVRGIASGDYDNDGYVDLLTSDPDGVQLYHNTGKGTFINTRSLNNYDLRGAVVVAFVDINNDGRNDIFVSRYARSNLLILNNGKAFQNAKTKELAAGDNLSMAAAFADIDQDGKLDIALGNWSHGQERAFNPRYSKNFYLLNRNEGFVKINLPGITGETLSVLLSDMNDDARPDLFVANDRQQPDMYYDAGDDGHFKVITPQSHRVPLTPLNTMSIESADFNNDGYLDLFSVDMSFREKSQQHYCDDIVSGKNRTQCLAIQKINTIVADNDMDACTRIIDPDDQQSCMTAILLRLATRQNNPALCQKISADQFLQKSLCEKLTRPMAVAPAFDSNQYLPQKQSNRLLFGSANGVFTDVTKQAGVTESLWSWNAKAADLDNDGWQDIYVANGYGQGKHPYEIDANIFYHNIQGEYFRMEEKKFGLDDYLNTPSYTYADIDNDGDLDIIATAINGPLRLYKNTQSKNHAIQIELRDARGNHFAIGSKIRIYLADGSQQLRELKLGGGFLSFDEPRAHFGLASNSAVKTVEITWPDGEKTLIDETLQADRRYRIERKTGN